MEYFALSKNVRVNPRKVRLIADAVKGLSASVALTRLDFLAKSASEPIAKAIKSALANGKNAQLKIKNILVDEGLKMKRRDTSHGARFGGGTITKRTSHIKVVLSDGQ
jgi:large subunit ribosomal protein L22